MSKYKNLEGLKTTAMATPFKGLFRVKWQADRILKKKRTENAWQEAAPVLENWITEFKEEREKEELAEYISRKSDSLYHEGGWELMYLERDPRDQYQPSPSAGEIRNLLENWPAYAEHRPDFPNIDDIDDLDALQDILCSGAPYDDIDGFESAEDFEIYAVLALMKVSEAVDFLGVKKSGASPATSWRENDLIIAGNLAIEAMEIICFADRALSDDQFKKMRAEQRIQYEKQVLIESRREIAMQGAMAKLSNDPKQKEKALVRECWEAWRKRPASYKGKSAFALDMLRSYDHLESQRVITDWCREWERESKVAVSEQGTR